MASVLLSPFQMKIMRVTSILLLLLSAVAASAQVERTITKTDRFDFGAGGTVSITGAPRGAIRVVGGQKNEIEIVATIKLTAPTEADIAKLAEITGFVTDESVGKVSILSLGVHAKQLLKKAKKKIPKGLADQPFTIDYVITVPRYCDLEIDGGIGDLLVENVEGSLFANFIETNARVGFTSGAASVTIQKGSLDASFGRVWRGRNATIQVGNGNILLRLPSTLSADIDAIVLRTGDIDNSFPDLKPRDRKVQFTDKSIIARAGVGGPPIKAGVGDGTITLSILER